nr:MAG: putative capsid protein [Canine stool-associated circular genome virus]
MPYVRSSRRRSRARRRLGYSRRYAYSPFKPSSTMRASFPSRKRSRTGAPLRTGRRVGSSVARSKSVKSSAGRVVHHGDNATSSYRSVGGSRLSPVLRTIMRKIVQSETVNTVQAGTLSCGYGVQGHSTFSILDKPTLTAMETAANDGTATDNSLRLFLKKAKVIYTLRNQTNTNAVVKLYDIVCKRDPPSTVMDHPREAWNKGLTDLGISNGYDIVGATPFKSPEFNHLFRVLGVTSLQLEPGMQHVHTVYHHYNKLFSTVRTQNVPGVTVAGFTRFIMPVFHGSLIHESLTPTSVTTAGIKLDYMVRNEYSFGYLVQNSPTYSIIDLLPKSITDPDFMGETGDADANVNIA